MVSPTRCYKVGRHVVPWGRAAARWGDTWHRRVGQWHSGATRGGTTMGRKGKDGDMVGQHRAVQRWPGNAGRRHCRAAQGGATTG
ncbi:hypothetical protein GUJ93_ZPchr0011g27141 [Zizania palustris]|uniref:Uncharacterized protein n=1 Tax=Zizania palustris TaxID=103762 RepID=A0A8J5WIN1_ZIZPA|nr:hypothetical protein GUJ93_ZPchr0011g27141 [Zizania palustris]